MKELRKLATKIGLAALLGASCITGQPKLEEKIEQQTTHQETEERNYRIVFQSDRDGNSEIYIMNADGSKQTNLTNNSNEDISPMPSPDGKMIAYVSNPQQEINKMEIFFMDANGENKRQLTDNSFIDRNPVWAPDSKTILFERHMALPKKKIYGYDTNNIIKQFEPIGIYIDLWQVDLNGNEKNLTRSISSNTNPSFSPNGDKITFTSDRDKNPDIYMMNADGRSQTRLTRNGGMDAGAIFSPNGNQILFYSHLGGKRGIYITDTNGSELDRLATTLHYYYSYSFSPDGKIIAYSDKLTEENPNRDIFLMNSNGGQKMNMTNSDSDEFDLKFSPDGRLLLFTRSEFFSYSVSDICVYDFAAKRVKKLTSLSSENLNASWLKF